MTTFDNILLALDGSPPSDAALDAACSLARDRGGRVTAVSVCPPRAFVHGHRVDWHAADSETHREAFALLRGAADAAQRDYGVALDTKVLDGDIVPALLEHARRIGADSVVIGSHGRGGIERALLGSVAEGLVRQSPVPVLVVHRAARNTRANTEPNAASAMPSSDSDAPAPSAPEARPPHTALTPDTSHNRTR